MIQETPENYTFVFSDEAAVRPNANEKRLAENPIYLSHGHIKLLPGCFLTIAGCSSEKTAHKLVI